MRLDVAHERDWAALCDATAQPYDGVVMRACVCVRARPAARPPVAHPPTPADARRAGQPLTPAVNLVHCTPEGHPENIFRNLSPKLATGRRVLAPGGWIAAYGAYLNDDGSFRSPADAKVRESGRIADCRAGGRPTLSRRHWPHIPTC